MRILVLISLEVAQKASQVIFFEKSAPDISWFYRFSFLWGPENSGADFSKNQVTWIFCHFKSNQDQNSKKISSDFPSSLALFAVYYFYFFFALQRQKKEKRRHAGYIGLVLLELKFHSFISSFVISDSLYFYLHHTRWWRKLEISSRHHCRARK